MATKTQLQSAKKYWNERRRNHIRDAKKARRMKRAAQTKADRKAVDGYIKNQRRSAAMARKMQRAAERGLRRR